MLNNYLPFTDSTKYQELQLVSYCLQNSEEWSCFKDVTTSLAITNYKLKQLIKNINTTGLITIDIQNRQKSFIKISDTDPVDLQKITTHAALHSLKFKIFLHLFMNVASRTQEDLQKKEGISAATYFRSKNALFQSLGAEKVTMISTSEAEVRLLITNVLYMFKYDKLFNIAEVSGTIHTLTDILTSHLNLTSKQQEKFFYFCWVNYLRYRMGMTLLATDRKYFLAKDNLPEDLAFKEQLATLLPELSNSDLEIFQRFCLSFLNPQTTQPEKILL